MKMRRGATRSLDHRSFRLAALFLRRAIELRLRRIDMQRVYYPSTGFLPVSDEILRLEDGCKIRFLQFFISFLSSFPFKNL